MKRQVLALLCCVFAAGCLRGQDRSGSWITQKTDSILLRLAKEENNDAKVDLVLGLFQSSIDGYPLIMLQVSQQLATLAQQKKDIIIEAAAWSTFGQGYRLTGNYVKGLECHRKAVALAEQSGHPVLLAFTLNQMGHIYKDRLENEKALALYRSALQLAVSSNSQQRIWFPFMNLAAVFYNAGELDSALYYAKIADTITSPLTNQGNRSLIFSTLGGIYSRKGDRAKAMGYFDKAISIASGIRSPRYMNSTYVALAEFFNQQQQYDSAMQYCKTAIEVVRNTEISHFALKPARMLIDYYQNINADSTVKYWKVYSAANDSLNNTRTNQQIQMLTFEDEQRKRDIEAAKILYRNKIRTGILLTGLGLIGLIAILLLRNNRQKQKANARLQQTLSELQAAQQQLIQSEKMASLGELTAGIAHEIQNPLNFVNNFSELNTELAVELQTELRKGDAQAAADLADTIRENSDKIKHHGKRADAIVKGMLQHSRSSTGQPELTDLNALCDEYLRLAYHGLRARDKSFQAGYEIQLDPEVGRVRVLPQELGRVVLNLINNAFYAVNDRKRSAEAGYQPLVQLVTRRKGNKVEISVKDNGTGIPAEVKEKIFQPFFTTKPTGQGTGLGLSLSYDIIKAHNGELQVETKEGEGTTFLIQLPVV